MFVDKPILRIAFPLICSLATLSLAQESTTSDSDPAYIRIVASNLRVSQTGSTDAEDRSRLCDGDQILMWNETEVRDNDHLVQLWLAAKAGDVTQLTVERKIGDETEKIQVPLNHVSAKQLFAPLNVGDRTEYNTPEDLFEDLEQIEQLPLRNVALEVLIEDEPLNYAMFLADAFRRLTDEVTGYYRSDHITYLLNRPFHCEAWSKKYCDALSDSPSPSDVVKIAWELADPLAGQLPPFQSEDRTWESLEELTKDLESRVKHIGDVYASALTSMDDSEKQAWNKWCRGCRPIWAGQSGWDEFGVGFQLTKKVDFELMAQAVAAATELAAELSPGGSMFESLKQFAASDTPDSSGIQSSLIAFGGSEKDIHEVQKAVTIDWGGDDDYLFPEDGLPTDLPVRFVVDLQGNDNYQAELNGIAAGVAGISVLIDAEGDDQYTTAENGIGYSVCGLGLLIDSSGHDHYIGQVFTQGAGCMGVGLVVDQQGNDRYDAGGYAQAIGLTAGCGAIVDFDGDDVYTCTGKLASPYGDAGEYTGMGQGCGFGFRRLGSGGVGILLDKAGSDFYRAGQFGLGCGYFYGVGVVNDRSGNDVFECSRYGLGTAAHYGIGIVLDDLGNDIFLGSRSAAVASLGSSWDLALGALIDSAGNDTYIAGTYTLGGSAQNAYGIFWDKAGKDFYSAGQNALGYAGSATYGAGRGARNLSIFLDEGSEEDTYRVPDRGNDRSELISEYAIWIDR